MTTITSTAAQQRSTPPTRQAAPQAQAAAEAGHDRIRRRAYEIFLSRNGGPGDPLSDWVRAERELNVVSVPALSTPAPPRSAVPAGPRTDARRERTARSEADV